MAYSKVCMLSTRRTGFTLIELLIIVTVVGILATIIVVSYSGMSKRAIEASMQSDLSNAATVVISDFVRNKKFPETAAEVQDGKGLSFSNGTTGTYVLKPYGFCISTTNPKTSSTYRFKSSTDAIDSGTCETVVSTFTGSGANTGFVPGTGTAANLPWATSLVIDSQGNTFTAHSTDRIILKTTPSGQVSAFAGTLGVSGYVNGMGTAAQFRSPVGIAIDENDILYVSDQTDHRIRKITPDGNVTTYAGTGTQGVVNGSALTVARFNQPLAIASTSEGILYVIEAGSRIRKVDVDGTVSTFAGIDTTTTGWVDGTGSAARFNNPKALTTDHLGNVYVGDTYNHRIRKITPQAVVTTIAGTGVSGYTDGSSATAQFNMPWSLTTDKYGNVYVDDQFNQRIRFISPSGTVSTIAGNGNWGFTDGLGLSARFWNPIGIELDAEGNMLVGDGSNRRVRKVTF